MLLYRDEASRPTTNRVFFEYANDRTLTDCVQSVAVSCTRRGHPPGCCTRTRARKARRRRMAGAARQDLNLNFPAKQIYRFFHSWRLLAADPSQGVRLRFESFHLEADANCQYDYVKVQSVNETRGTIKLSANRRAGRG